MDEAPERTAVLVVRLWQDPSAPGEVRGRIRSTGDILHQPETVVAVATIEEAMAAMTEWLLSVRDAAVTAV